MFARSFIVLMCVWAVSVQAHNVHTHQAEKTAGAQTTAAHHHAAHHPARPRQVGSLDEVQQRLKQYQLTGDDSLLVQAQGYFEREGADTSPRAVLLRAWLSQAQHHFETASRQLEPLLHHGGSEVWLLEANLQRIMGHYAASRSACRRVAMHHILLGRTCLLSTRLSAEPPAPFGSRSVAVHPGEPASNESLGRMVREIESLQQVYRERKALHTSQQAWVAGVLADAYDNLGQLDRALHWSAAALETMPSVQYTARYAGLLLGGGQPQHALDVLGNHAGAPALVVLQLRALLNLGRTSEAQAQIAQVDAQFKAHIREGDFLHAREMSQFYLDILPDTDLAARLVKENWARQKEPEDLHLLARVERLETDG